MSTIDRDELVESYNRVVAERDEAIARGRKLETPECTEGHDWTVYGGRVFQCARCWILKGADDPHGPQAFIRDMHDARLKAEAERDRAEARVARLVAELERCREAHAERGRTLRPDRVHPDVLKRHYLAEIVCDHGRKMDQPRCSCSLVNLGWHPTVGEAVDAWIEHVVAEDRAGLHSMREEPMGTIDRDELVQHCNRVVAERDRLVAAIEKHRQASVTPSSPADHAENALALWAVLDEGQA